MKLVNLQIYKFRSIEYLSLDATDLTVLCGANSCGKSNVLRAIRFAFVPEYDRERMHNNFPLFISSGNALIRIKLVFDEPTGPIAAALSLPHNKAWTYEVTVKRSGFASFYINGQKVQADIRDKLLDNVWVVFVPPVRDIAGDGLQPFRQMLGDAIRQARSGTSVASASNTLRTAVTAKGKQLLSGPQFPKIGNLEVDLAGIDFEAMLSEAIINVRTEGGLLPLQGFGTGHQSQVVLGLYRQIGQGLQKFVLFQFEEPDNHMHTMAMRTIAEDLTECSSQPDTQVFVTTHSPALMNQFELRTAVGLVAQNGRTEKRKARGTLSDREYRVGLSQFGLRPAEALTARLVVVVEGATDVTLVRTLYRNRYNRDPERDDVLIVASGGKDLAAKLSRILNELGVYWKCVLDYDACLNESRPYFLPGLTATQKGALRTHVDSILPSIFAPAKTPKSVKMLAAMKAELDLPGAPQGPGFQGSVVSSLIDHVKVLSAVERSIVAKAAIEGKHSKWRDPLWRSHIWLWSSDPENLLVATDSALHAAEEVLRRRQFLVEVFPDRDKLRAAVTKKLHQLASEPTVLEDTLLAVLSSGSLGTTQFGSLAARLAVPS